MTAPFQATRPFRPDEFPTHDKPFPIVEVFGYDRTLPTVQAREAFNGRMCPFRGKECEKFTQYTFGYCSVDYRGQQYAVCDHRLDGPPVWHAVRDHFPDPSGVRLVDEVKITAPDQSFDFVAIDPVTDDFIAIETQAIDLRGGGVGPAWRSIEAGEPATWRQLFTDEVNEYNARARRKREDRIAYGVNTANITKRLGVQIADKGSLLKRLGAKLYVVAQDVTFDYFESRVPVIWVTEPEAAWDITFVTFGYTRNVLPDGAHEFTFRQLRRTTLESFSTALATTTSAVSRDDFVRRVREKAGLA